MIIYILYFLITIIVELPVIYYLTKIKLKEAIVYSFLINSFTWPLAMIAYNLGANFYLIEVLVALTESILLLALIQKNYLKLVITTLIMNAITAALSFLL